MKLVTYIDSTVFPTSSSLVKWVLKLIAASNLHSRSLYPRHTKYVGVYSFRSSVRPFVRSYVRSFVHSFVRSFVFPSQGHSFCVKVYKTSYFEDPLMDFVHIWHDGRYRSKVFISTIPTPGWPWEQGHRLWIFVKKSQGQSFCVKVYKTSYFEDPLMDFIHIWHDGRYRSKVFISTIPIPGVTLGQGHGLRIFIKKVKVFCV